MTGFEDFANLVRARRSNLAIISDRQVDSEVVTQLCELAMWAPNHKQTFPLQVAAVAGDGRCRLSNVVADALEAIGERPERVAKTRTKFQRAPIILVIGTAIGQTPLRTAENRDAVAAGIQNILLGATALGLASFWTSCPTGVNDIVANFCQFTDQTHITAIIYLGYAQHELPAVDRPPATINRISE